MERLIDERDYLRAVRLPSGEVRLDVRAGVVGEWRTAQVFTEPVAGGVMAFFEQACDLTIETLGDELLARDADGMFAGRETLEREAEQVRRLYRALSEV